MTCDEARYFLNAYVDGELELTRRLDVETHLAGCAGCKAAAEQIANFNSLVRTEMEAYRAPRELKSKIRTSLRKESEPKFAYLFKYGRPLAYAAAILVLSFALAWGWLTLSRSKHQDLIAEAISNHSRSLMVSHLVDCHSSDQQTVQPWFNGQLDYSPSVVKLEEAGYTLVGGRVDILEKRPVAAIVYQRGKQIINLFVWPAAGRKIDIDARSERGYQYCGWNQAGLNYLCVSEISGDDLEKFENQVREHLNLKTQRGAFEFKKSGVRLVLNS
jgi:anti-sigma factor RsiW